MADPIHAWVEAAKRPPRSHDTTEPVASWTEQELLEGRRVEAFVAILRTRGCYWSINSGCTMCGYFNDTVPQGVSTADLKAQWGALMDRYQGQPMVKLYTSGSYLDPRELDPELQGEFLAELADRGAVKVVVESLPEFVHERTLAPLVEAAATARLELALGLESADERVLALSVNKKLTRKGFARACAAAQAAGAGLKAYVLLKPPFLTEAAAIGDSVAAARFAAQCGCASASLNPVNVQRHTLVESLWRRGEYSPPWLWSVVEVIRRFESEIRTAGNTPDIAGDFRFYSDPTGGGSRRGAHNCTKCNDRVVEALRAHRLGDKAALKYLVAEGCTCRAAWSAEVALGPLLRGSWGAVGRR